MDDHDDSTHEHSVLHLGRLVRILDERTECIMSQLDDLNGALTGLQTVVADAAKRTTDDLAALKGELQQLETQQGVDLSGPIGTVTQIQQQVAGIDAPAAVAADPAAAADLAAAPADPAAAAADPAPADPAPAGG